MKPIELILDEDSSSNYYIKEAFNSLRANILFSKKDVKTIVLTSCLAHEGKSSVCFELCRNLAEAGKKILLVDADMRKSVMITRYTNEKGVYGLSHVLSGQVSNEEAVYNTSVENLDIVFSGPYPPNPTELIGSPAFKEFLDENRDAYDYIIVDAPPLGLVVDAAVMSNVCDGAILVINVGHVKYRMAQQVKAQLEKSGKKILGVILNQVDRKKTIKSDYSFYATYFSESSDRYYAADRKAKKK
ncbi:MAG: CpsD/CapB family tyrosine-protein kinase [Ruminococcaceae bacterium]|nr:CpsD/CapB family tyrosine-protein kinase [Oscillospiraceae bacterium]